MSDTFEWNQYNIYKNAIGKGSYSKVYRGYHMKTKLEVAIKKIQFTKLPSNVKDKVISEINILQKMDHNNIMKMYEYKFDGDYIVLVTEYCKDGDLEQWIKKNNNMIEKINVIKQITIGIEYMHTNNILHRDIKPQNILLHNNIIKICDFGFSTTIKEHNMMFNTICGTPLYMSPELLFMKPYTIMSEIWALGILFYIIIYNVHPFGTLINLDDYRVKISMSINDNHIQYKSIKDYEYIVDIIKSMLRYKMDNRPNINTIISRLNIIENKLLQFDDNTMLEVDKSPFSSPTLNALSVSPIDRINELEEEVFRLESIIKEKELNRSSLSCCFDSEDDITGRGRTNKGYENITIDKDYFTPPGMSSMRSIPINITMKNSPNISSSYGSNSSGKSLDKPKSFLSSSIDKITAFFSSKKS
jgi:serine/threonine protein kinase